eukprot:COSAG01_NODE_8427_length_2787_cov_29.997396_1_plen_472_part_00
MPCARAPFVTMVGAAVATAAASGSSSRLPRVAVPLAAPVAGSRVGRAPMGRGCVTAGGAGEYVVQMSFDNSTGDGSSVTLNVVLDTGSANLQVVSSRNCSSCRNLTSMQYPGPVSGPGFEISPAYGTYLGHATSAMSLGELTVEAVEFSAITSVSPRFFQGAARPGDNCFDAYQGLIGLGMPSMARGGVASPMTQFVERGVGDGFTIQLCPWIGDAPDPPGTPPHVGHFWLGGWDSHYTDQDPTWEPMSTCTSVTTNAGYATCAYPHAWTPHAYGVQLRTIEIDRASGRTAVAMPIDLNLRGTNASNNASAGWTPHYSLIMPEGGLLMLNSDANVQALTKAMGDSGYVHFPRSTTDDQRAAFWRGELAIQGATARGTQYGLTLVFAHGATVRIEGSSLFATTEAGLKQVGVDGRRGYRETVVGLSVFIENVVMFDHAQRRIGFATGRNCAQNPQRGQVSTIETASLYLWVG